MQQETPVNGATRDRSSSHFAPVRVGVIGCGRIARGVHLPLLAAMPGAQVSAIADPDANNRMAASSMVPSARAFESSTALLGAGGVEAVVICLPSYLHASCAVAAFQAGLHVYVEKPLATSLTDGIDVATAWRKSGKIGMLGFNFRHHSQIQDIREQVQRGQIGTLLNIRSVFSILAHELPAWKRARESGGGVILDLASHHIDLAEYVSGKRVVRVIASLRSLESAGDNATISAELEEGATFQSFVSLGSVDEHRVEFYGTAGKLIMDRTELRRASYIDATMQGARTHRIKRALIACDPRVLLRSPGAEPSFAVALQEFIAAVSSGSCRGPDIDNGVHNVAVVEAAERSVRSGAWEIPVTMHAHSAAPQPITTGLE